MSNDVPGLGADTRRRPVSIPHLVFGVVFLGIAAIRFIGEATDADLPRSAIGFPIVLIGAGAIGLVATVVNARRRGQPPYVADAETDTATDTATDTEITTVLEENQR